MSKDITPILAGWEHDPEDLQVRIIPGVDGREKLQMRIDLGLIQMELHGRPDGRRPFGCESLLESLETRATDLGPDFTLEGPDCVALMREGIQYYHRYLALFHLQRFDLVARDTERNLRLFAFVVRHAAHRRDRVQFDQYRPYVTMMHTRALAEQSLAREDHATALAQIERGIQAIRDFLHEYGQSERESTCPELDFLRRWQREVQEDRPIGPIERLEQQLDRAVAQEEFEEAARLRDQIRRLREATSPDRHPSPPS